MYSDWVWFMVKVKKWCLMFIKPILSHQTHCKRRTLLSHVSWSMMPMKTHCKSTPISMQKKRTDINYTLMSLTLWNSSNYVIECRWNSYKFLSINCFFPLKVKPSGMIHFSSIPKWNSWDEMWIGGNDEGSIHSFTFITYLHSLDLDPF